MLIKNIYGFRYDILAEIGLNKSSYFNTSKK